MLKRKMAVLSAAVVLVAGSLAGVWAGGQKPKSELITGEIGCLYCHMAKSEMGADPAGCVARCIEKKSMPPIIVQEGTGEIYVAVFKEGESAVKKLVPLVGKKINAQGPVYRQNGLNMIEINVVSEAM